VAPTFRHSKGAAVLIDEKNMSQFLRSATISANMDAGDTTVLASSWKTYLAGQRDATLSAEGLFAASTTPADDVINYLDGALGGSTRFVVTFGPEGDSTGRRAFLMVGDAVTYDISAPASDLVSIDLDVQASGGFQPGRWLRPLSASTSTGSNSAVTFTGTTASGGSTGGGAHLHVTSVASTFGSATFKIQHSTNGSTWADLITFTAATGVTFQRSTVSGTVKERVRSTLSSYTSAGASDTITASVAFARNGSPKM
jgi:hypothetical protein